MSTQSTCRQLPWPARPGAPVQEVADRATFQRASVALLAPLLIVCYAICAGAEHPAAATWLNADIGAPATAGSHTSANGELTVIGAGNGDKTNGPDQLHYTYAAHPGGDIDVIARIVSIRGERNARAGIMLRDGNSPSDATTAQVVFCNQAANDGKHNLSFAARDHASKSNSSSGITTRMQVPLWLRLVRIGRYFAVYKSPDGKIWSMLGNTSGSRFAPEGPIEVGFFVSSGDPAKTASVTFDSIVIGKPNLGYSSSWIGNTFSGNVADGHVSNGISALWVAPDGTCYTNSYWDEGAESSKIYKDGKVVTSFRKENECFGNDSCGEGTISSDGKRMFLAAGRNLYMTDMLGHGSTTRPIYFATDLWYKQKNINVSSGLAVVGGKLYVSNARDNKIMVARTDLPLYYTAGNSSVNITAQEMDTKGVAGAAPPIVYQSQRECDYLPYVIPGLEANVSYTVRCHFAEYTEDKPGRRLINIGASGAQGVRGYDVVAAAGGKFKPAVKDIEKVQADNTGKLTVVFERGQGGNGHIVICGFEILKADGTPAFAVNCGGLEGGQFKAEASELPNLAFAFTRPGPLSADKRDELWIIQEANDFPAGTTLTTKYPGAVKCYRSDGTFTGREITDVVNPTALAYDAVNDRLLVGENGPDQNIRIYSNLAGKPMCSRTFGVKGGLYAGANPGRIADAAAGGHARFYGLTGVGVDAQGNIYVASSLQGTDLRKLSPEGRLVWMVNSLFFCNTADVDPDSNGAEVYSPYVHLTLDCTKTAPGSEWSYAGYNWDPLKYGPAPRAGGSQAIVRRVGPNRALAIYTSGQGVVEYVGVFRFDGEIAVPCGQIRDKSIWIDSNGDGKESPNEVTAWKCPGSLQSFCVDRKGDVWLALIANPPVVRRVKLKGLNAQGAPIYGAGAGDYEDAPYPGIGAPVNPWGQIVKVNYDSERDVMYLLGPAKDRKSDKEDPINYLACYDDWSKGNRTARWLITLPNPDTDPNFMYEVGRPWGCAFHWMGLDVADDKVFLAELWGPIHIYDAATGKLLIILNAGPEVSGCNAWEDANLGVRAFKRKNGEFIIFSENSGYNGKDNMFRWEP